MVWNLPYKFLGRFPSLSINISVLNQNPDVAVFQFKPEGGQAATALKQMTRDKAPSQWDDSDWTVALRQMPGAVKADDLRKMSKDTTKRM